MDQIIDLVAGNDNGTRINNNVTNAIVLPILIRDIFILLHLS
jgi:hypothetical protein